MDARKTDEVEERSRLGRQLADLVGHDLRNPLAAIEMGTQLLRRGALKSSQRRVLDHIGSANERAQRLVADLADFVDCSFGSGLAVVRQPLVLHAVVAERLAQLGAVSPGRLFEHDRIGEGDCTGDADRLAQLVGHLVNNALAYGAPDRPVIVASIVEPTCFRIVVHNEGAPVDEALRPALFTPVAHGRATAAGRSLGLGLYLVRQIARVHGGDAVLRSDVTGTTVTATFRRGGDDAEP